MFIIASDHGGLELKDAIKSFLADQRIEVRDLGTMNSDSVDYPDFAEKLATALTRGEAENGILICGTGIGMSIAANKVRGIRAALCHDELTAEMSRRHNDANVLCMPADLVGEELIKRIVEIWIETEFEGGRHGRRVDKVMEFEAKMSDCEE